jgi:hypothetical protein
MLRALRVLHFSGWLLDDPDGLWALEPVAV